MRWLALEVFRRWQLEEGCVDFCQQAQRLERFFDVEHLSEVRIVWNLHSWFSFFLGGYGWYGGGVCGRMGCKGAGNQSCHRHDRVANTNGSMLTFTYIYIYIYITTTCHHLNHLFEGDPHIEGSQTCRYPHFTGSWIPEHLYAQNIVIYKEPFTHYGIVGKCSRSIMSKNNLHLKVKLGASTLVRAPGIATRSKQLLVTSASLLVTSALLVVTRSY